MEKAVKEADLIIEKIDNKLLELHLASENKSDYEFFDLYSAWKAFYEWSLKEGDRKDYFKMKSYQYYNVFRDLMVGPKKIIRSQTISFNFKTKIHKVKYQTRIIGCLGWAEYDKEFLVNDKRANAFFKTNLKYFKENPTEHVLNKYEYLLEECKINFPSQKNISQTDKNALMYKMIECFKEFYKDKTFDSGSDIIKFEDYIKDLQFRKNILVIKEQTSTENPHVDEELDNHLTETVEIPIISDLFKQHSAQKPQSGLTFKNVFLSNEKLGNASEIYKFIKEMVERLDDGWKYVFKKESDFNTFLDLFTKYFAEIPYNLPEMITWRDGCKTNFAPILGMIQREYGKVKPKNRDFDYFELLKIFNEFKDVAYDKIYRDIKRKKEII